jgi:hypothetical protein
VVATGTVPTTGRIKYSEEVVEQAVEFILFNTSCTSWGTKKIAVVNEVLPAVG